MPLDPYSPTPLYDEMRQVRGPEDYRGPLAANPMDSRFGGPTPWTQSLASYVALGAPAMGDRPFEGMGKTDISANLPVSPLDRANPYTGVQPLGAPQPGLGEALLGGLTGLGAELVGGILQIPGQSGHVTNAQRLAVDVMGGIGSLFDGILDVPGIFIDFDGQIEEAYKDLAKFDPDDALRMEYEKVMADNPTQRIEYMKQYLDKRGSEVARMRGMSGAFAELLSPSASTSEMLRRMIFGSLMVSGDAVARTYIGSGLRDVQGTILDAPMEELPEELKHLRVRYENGELTRDELYDEILLGRYRWTHDEGLTGMAISMVMDIVSDPLTWASFGIGGAAKAAGTKAVRLAHLRVGEAITKGTRADEMARALAPKFKMTPEEILKSASPDVRKAQYEWAERFAKPEFDRAVSTLTRKQYAAYKLDPIIQPAAKVANEIDSLFGMFGASRISKRFSAIKSNAHLTGFVRYHGVKRVMQLQRSFGNEGFDKMNRYLGIASANNSLVMFQKMQGQELRAADVAGQRAAKKSGVIKDPSFTPTDEARARRDISLEEGFADEMEAHLGEYSEHFLSKGELGEEAVIRQLQKSRDDLAADWAAATGKTLDAAKADLASYDRRGMQLVHQVLFGKQIDDFNLAKVQHEEYLRAQIDQARKAGDTTRMAELQEALDNLDRYTLVSENLLTKTDAQTVLSAISADTDAARQAASEAIAQYDQLRINWGGRAMDPDVMRLELKHHLETLLSKEGTLTEVIPTTKLHSTIAGSLGTRYRVGLAPTDLWGIVKKADGSIQSVNTFVELLSDQATGLSRRMKWYDRVKEGMFGPIHGARIHAEAKLRFRLEGQREFGLSINEADTLFNAINAQAIVRNRGARGFSAAELMDIAETAGVTIPDMVNAKYGQRAVLELTLRAFQNDIATLGISSGVSAKFKTRTGRLPLGDNLVGKIAEDIYPRLRFTLSPIFLAMEMTEGPFFAILRGIKPGYRWTVDDIRMNSILRVLKPDHVENGAGIGRAHLAYAEGKIAAQISEAGRFTQTWNKLMPARFQRDMLKVRGPRVYNVYEWKKVLYVRQAGREAAESWVRMMERQAPEVLGQWQTAANSMDPVKTFMAFMEDRGAYDPSVRHTVHMFDAAKPANMGRDRLRMGDVAQFQGYKTTAMLRKSIKDGNLTRDQFIDKYTRLGLDRSYAERAWKVASGFGEDEWEHAIREAVGVEAAESTIGFHKWLANALGLSYDEFLNTQYSAIANIVNNARQVPAAAFKQTVRDSLERAGMRYLKRGDRLFDLAHAKMQAKLPQHTPARRGKLSNGEVSWVKTSDPALVPAVKALKKKYSKDAEAKALIDDWAADLKGILDTAAPEDHERLIAQWFNTFMSTGITFRMGGEVLGDLYDVNGRSGLVLLVADKLKIEAPVNVKSVFDPNPVPFADRVTVRHPVGTLGRKIDNAQAQVKANPGKYAPPKNDWTAKLHSPDIKVRNEAYKELFQAAQQALGGVDETILNSANWYDEMMSTFLGLSFQMPDSLVARLLEEWSTNNPLGVIENIQNIRGFGGLVSYFEDKGRRDVARYIQDLDRASKDQVARRPKVLKDENGLPVLEEPGNPWSRAKYEQQLDEFGKPMYDEYGKPIYVMEDVVDDYGRTTYRGDQPLWERDFANEPYDDFYEGNVIRDPSHREIMDLPEDEIMAREAVSWSDNDRDVRTLQDAFDDGETIDLGDGYHVFEDEDNYRVMAGWLDPDDGQFKGITEFQVEWSDETGRFTTNEEGHIVTAFHPSVRGKMRPGGEETVASGLYSVLQDAGYDVARTIGTEVGHLGDRASRRWKNFYFRREIEKGKAALFEDARLELAAALNLAFSGSQMNTSVLDGMRKVTKMLEEIYKDKDHAALREEAIRTLQEKKPREWKATADNLAEREALIEKQVRIRYGFETVGKRLSSIIKEFGEMPPEAIAQKLSDFNDNLAGKLERSSHPGDGLQPAAMDIWMKRVWGYPDDAYVSKLAQKLMRDNPGKFANEKAAARQVMKDHNWKPRDIVKASGKDGNPTAPSAHQYEWMLQRTNEMKDWLNAENIKGPNGEWAAHEIQALLWVAEQKKLDYADNPTFSLFQQTGRHLGVDDLSTNESWIDRYPDRESLTRHFLENGYIGSDGKKVSLTYDQAQMHVDDVMAAVQQDINLNILAAIAENTGITTIRTVPGLHDLGSSIVFGSENMSLETARHLAAALDRPITVIGRPPDVVLKTTKAKPIAKSNIEGQQRYWSFDFAFDPEFGNADVQRYLRPLREYLSQYLDADMFPASVTTVLDDNAVAMRNVYDPRKNPAVVEAIQQMVLRKSKLRSKTGKTGKMLTKAIGEAKKGVTSLEDVTAHSPLPPNVLDELADGTWVKHFDPDAEPMPVALRHEQVSYHKVTPEEGVSEVGPELVTQYRGRAQQAADEAYSRHAGEATTNHQRTRGISEDHVFNQRDNGGAVRAGFKAATASEGASLYFVRNAVDATSAIHESFHLFSRLIDDSAKREFVDAYNAAHGLSGTRSAKRGYVPAVEEWVAEQFEAYAAGQVAGSGQMAATFKAFAEWGKKNPGIPAGGLLDDLFDNMLARWSDTPVGYSSLDERRIWESTRIALMRAENNAHTTAYYRRGPNWMMRSLNHPYLGMYPASYMWGKVLPEMTRFLVRRPFGLKAPLGGAMMFNHVYRNIQMQLQVDQGLNDFIEEHPDTTRFLTLMIPGSPVEMPVNAPVVLRRAMEQTAENRVARLQGKEEEPYDVTGSVSDMLSYAVGYTNLFDRTGKMIGELFGEDKQNAGKIDYEFNFPGLT